MKYFVISPVRKMVADHRSYLERIINTLEICGHEIFWPWRDNKANKDKAADEYDACKINWKAMEEADEVLVFLFPNSLGIAFDLGMAYATGKTIQLINTDHSKKEQETKFRATLNAALKYYKEGE